jgi:carboxylate-amine ligase
MGHRTVGLEEEFLLVDPDSGRPRAMAEAMVASTADADDPLDTELQLQQIETATPPCSSLAELATALAEGREHAREVAREHGADVVAVATSPIAVNSSLYPSRRYRRMAERFGMTADEQLCCGCHVHVEVGSRDEGVAVLDRIRPWLSVLLAVSTNSPFWNGHDSGYASYRTRVWSRWPCAGPTELFGCAREYHQTVQAMVNSGTILDEGMVYFDARLSRQYPTVELRVADVCSYTDDAVLLAALARALVDTAARQWRADIPPAPVRTEMLKLASWRAGRSGVEGELIDPRTWRPTSAATVVHALLDHVRSSLEEHGDHQRSRELTDQLLARGTGSTLQRADYRDHGHLSGVVAAAIRRTHAK